MPTEQTVVGQVAKASRHRPRYQPQSAFSTWLFRGATNHGIGFIRRNKLQTLPRPQGRRVLYLEVADRACNPQEACIHQQCRVLQQQVE